MFRPIAKTGDIPIGQPFLADVEGVPVAVCNVGGEFYAFEDACSHDGASFDMGFVEGNEIICPRHGAAFDVTTGKNLCPPAFSPVRTYPVRTNGDVVEIDIDG